MCIACINNPLDIIEDTRLARRLQGALRDAEERKQEAKLIKDAIKASRGRWTCGAGDEILEALKERQYELAREL